ncbi:MAG: flagellar hook-associated protein FlgK, partial [Tepidanaerobacteraceae bacterium]
MSSFFGIEIAKKALFANQRAQQTVSHNISNANTPGYSRQRVMLESTYTSYGFGAAYQLGTGVKLSDISRIRDDFTDRQYRNENSSLGQWDIQSDILKQVEAVFNEPSDIGISSVLNEFWKSLETLSKDPSSQEARETVKERGITLTNTINHAFIQLNDIINDINYRISVKVNEINSIANQIAQLNLQIQQTQIGGASAADLMDKRDLLLDELSNLVQFESYEDENGQFTINVGGALLVKG